MGHRPLVAAWLFYILFLGILIILIWTGISHPGTRDLDAVCGQACGATTLWLHILDAYYIDNAATQAHGMRMCVSWNAVLRGSAIPWRHLRQSFVVEGWIHEHTHTVFDSI